MPLLFALFGLSAIGEASALECGTPAFFEDIRRAVPQPAVTPPPTSGKAEREAHGGCAGSHTTDNFIVKWGQDAPPAEADLDLIVSALETAWQYQLNQMDHAHPYGSDTHLFNVYVGDSGDCAPSAMGMGGYYTVDPDGWPMIVLSQGVFDNPDYGRTTVAHEFYHAVQHAEQAYLNDPAAQWWWEATAMWVEGEVYPATTDYFVFLYGYAFEPHRQLNSYTYPSQGLLEEYHQYGAAIWPRYLTEFVTESDTIRDSWAAAGPNDDPMEVLTDLMGEDLAPHFADFAAHNATWDYFHGDEIAAWLDYISDAYGYGAQDRRLVETLDYSGTGGEWAEPPAVSLPHRYGYNVIRVRRPQEGAVTIRFRGDALGSEGSPSEWAVRVVRELSQRVEYETIELVDGEGEVTIDVLGTEQALYVVSSVVSPAWNDAETFDYQYQVSTGAAPPSSDDGDPAPPDTPLAIGGTDSDENAGCQCASSPTVAPRWAWAVLVPLLGWLRRDPR
jgi:hypothetical protein